MDDSDDIAISALEHFSYCPRQFGLIHIERVWRENEMTVQGSRAHERVDLPITRHERSAEVWRGVPLWSATRKLYGRADVIEVLDDATILPVEYKRGDRSPSVHEKIQLCAQALCLEEMLSVRVEEGALYHVASKKRVKVPIDGSLRSLTEETVRRVRAHMDTGDCPGPNYDERCEGCSLQEDCLPQLEGVLAGDDPPNPYSVGSLHDWAEVSG